jgi:hypothetical protein
MARLEEQSRRYTQLVEDKMMELGFIVNEKKPSLEPSQSLDHLGFLFDTHKMMLAVPKTKLRDLRPETAKNLSSFIGKTTATTPAVFPECLKFRSLLSLKISAL